MALELKSVFETLGIDGDPATLTIEDFKKKVDTRFITLEEAPKNEDVIKKVQGGVFFEFQDALKKEFKDLGVENSELKDKPWREQIQLVKKKASDKIAELTEASGKGNDEKVIKLTKDLEKVSGQASQYKTDLEKVLGEKTELETSFNGKLKSFKLNDVIKTAKSKLQYSDSFDELKKRGFDSLIGEKYKFDLDENDKPVVTTTDGKPVPHKSKTGVYLTIEEVLAQELDAVGGMKKNNLDGRKPFNPARPADSGEGNKTRNISPAAAARMEKFASK